LNILFIILGCVVGIFLGYFLAKVVQRKKIGEYETIGKKILEDAKKRLMSPEEKRPFRRKTS